MANMNYVSVTAGKNAEEANAVLSEFQKAGYSLNSKYVPALGIQASEKTLSGIKPQNLRLAEFAEISSLMQIANGKAMPVIHYNTKNTDTLSEQVSKALEKNYDYCKLVQINASFPDISHFEKLKERFADLKISLQVDYRQMDIDAAASKIIAYGNCIDYVLIDPSRGRGDLFDIEKSCSLYLKVKERMPDYGVVFAGGFSGDNAEQLLTEIADKIKTKDFSICAEGKLRDKVSDEHWGMDVLNIEKVKSYLQAVSKVMK
ncbi:MAG: hypothetical protein WC852_03210 [Candidatus Nanoarchaeia archaeon]|jgi:phosphoribosylanthranilate isomerase